MTLTLKVIFHKKVKNKNEQYFYEVSSSNRELPVQLKTLMKKLVLLYFSFPKTEKGFVVYDSIQLYCNDEKKETFYPIQIHKGNKINIEYILNFNWSKLSELDVCKIIDLNFSYLIWSIKENKRNRIRNLANTDNPLLLSNGQGLVKFKTETSPINTYIEPLFIRRPHYKTFVSSPHFRTNWI